MTNPNAITLWRCTDCNMLKSSNEWCSGKHLHQRVERVGNYVPESLVGEAEKEAIRAERERMVGELENAATDCDGHTPYSILMALATELRELEALEAAVRKGES